MADYDSNSRFYNQTPITASDGVTAMGLWTRPAFLIPGYLNAQDIITIKIDQLLAGRPDNIAFQLYGNADLDWIIVMFNNSLNTLGWPTAGTIITAPTKTAVSRYL